MLEGASQVQNVANSPRIAPTDIPDPNRLGERLAYQERTHPSFDYFACAAKQQSA